MRQNVGSKTFAHSNEISDRVDNFNVAAKGCCRVQCARATAVSTGLLSPLHVQSARTHTTALLRLK